MKGSVVYGGSMINACVMVKMLSTAIPRWKYRFSSDHRSQATSGQVSTWMGDRLGIPGAVDFFFLRHCFCLVFCFFVFPHSLTLCSSFSPYLSLFFFFFFFWFFFVLLCLCLWFLYVHRCVMLMADGCCVLGVFGLSLFLYLYSFCCVLVFSCMDFCCGVCVCGHWSIFCCVVVVCHCL